MSGVSSDSGTFVYWSFSRQPAQVLIVDASPPWWSDTCEVLCDALDDFLSLACSLDRPCRIPLLSLYAISRQQECLLPFAVRLWKCNIRCNFCSYLLIFLFHPCLPQQVRGNLARLRSCVEELRSISSQGCIRGATRGGELLQQSVLDSLQQFKQYMRHTSTAGPNSSVEVRMESDRLFISNIR